ncbi:MAG: hypothetical protein AB1427_06380 [Thermodesulfobacteriota bacterium]
MKILILIVSLLAAGATPSLAEPDEGASFLINDSVSMLDFGIYKLENEIRAIRNDLTIRFEPPYSAFVDYDWDKNKIMIVLSYGDPGDPPVKEIKSEITTVVAALKKKFGVTPAGDPFEKGGFSSIGDYFSHRGYTRKNTPRNLRRDIDKLVEIKILFYVQNYSRYFECRNRLVGSSSENIICTDYLP